MSNSLVISALGHDRPGLVAELTQSIATTGCNIADSRMCVLGDDFAIIMLINGPWNSIAKLEDLLPSLKQQLNLKFTSTRTKQRTLKKEEILYSVDVVSIDHPGIVHDLAHFFSEHTINIHDIHTSSYRAAYTGTQLFSLHMTVEIPAKTHIGTLREEFMEFCDQLNLDAIIEPVKI